MVSPSKKKKSDSKGRENGLLNKPNSKKSSKPYKPLSSKKFYLDIKNHASVAKLEKKLKLLGATIEFFLIKEVDYVVSDRKVTAKDTSSANTPGTATPSPSPSPAFLSSPADGGVPKKSRTRAEAMLQKVCLQPKHLVVDPLDNARSWNIPIYSLQVFVERLDKLCAKAISHSSSTRNRKVSLNSSIKVLKGNYLKIETGARPEFRELQEWPSINFNSRIGDCPFSPPRHKNKNGSTRRMTRKLTRGHDESDRIIGGYCELCRVDYADLKPHLVSAQHMKFATSADTYMQLDNLIKTKNVDAFLAAQMCPSLVETRRSLRSGSVDVTGAAMGIRQSAVPQPTTPVSSVLPSLPNGQVISRTRSSTLQLRQSLDDSFTKKPLEVQCNGAINHCHYTRYAVKSDGALPKDAEQNEEIITKRTRTFSASCPGTTREFSQLSPTGSDITHHLRSRKQIFLPSNLLGTTAEDALRSKGLRDSITEARVQSPVKTPVKSPLSPSPVKSLKALSTQSSNTKNCNKSNHSVKMTKTTKKKKSNKRRLNPEEKLLEDNKAYYKVEVLNTKLRSTGYYLSQRELEVSKVNGADSSVVENCVVSKNDQKTDEKEPVVVRFQKIRKTELSLLSDEAENFMFGEPIRKDSSEDSSEEEDDEDDASTTAPESEDNKKSIKVKIKKEDIQDENSIGSCSIASSCSSYRRKRPTQAEAFIRDNLDYYKFELSGSRLRYQGSILPHIPEPKEVFKSEDDPLKENCKVNDVSKTDKKIKLENDSERVSECENSNDVEEESIGDEKLEQITFSFEGIPESETWYRTYKRQDNCEETYYPCHHEYPKILLPYQFPSSVRHNLSNSDKGFVRKRQSRFLVLDDKPRKSPRCHASTLAIMSSLLRRRSKDPTSSTPSQPEPVSDPLLQNEESRSSIPDTPIIPEIKVEPKPEVKQNVRELSKVLDDVFASACVEDDDDKYAQTLKAIKKDLEADKETDSPPKRGKVKSSRLSSSKRECSESELCLPVDSDVLSEVGNFNPNCAPGPTVDVMSLLDNFRYCTSMERADYEHMNPRAVDALRALTVDASCNSSDCGASSTCEGMSFLDDGRLNRRRKRKKRNLTGWPLGKPRRKLIKKVESPHICKIVVDSGLVKTSEICEITSVNSESISEVTSEPKCSAYETTKIVSSKLNSLSRTTSVDSSLKSDFQECCIKIRKLSESSTRDGFVVLKKSASTDSLQSSSPNKYSPKRSVLRRKSSDRDHRVDICLNGDSFVKDKSEHSSSCSFF